MAEARSKHQRVLAVLVDRITSGTYPVGEPLPGRRGLAAELGVSVGTLVRAVAELERLGMAESLHGAGTYVTSATAREQPPTFEERLDALERRVDRLEGQQ